MPIRFEVVSGTERDFERFMNQAIMFAKERKEVLKQINYSTTFAPEHRNDFGRVPAEVIHSALLTFTYKEED